TMQGSKKHAEGHSDSSSIGSLLDDTDREVSSLTDRAFKSLCVAELGNSYNEPDLAISPDFALQFSAKFHAGTLNHTIKKSNVCSNLTPRNNEHTTRASTFQQLPKCAPEEKRIGENNTFATDRKNLNLPVPGPRNKHVSKVSSLIKTFDKTTDQGSGGSLMAVKQPIKNSFQKCKLNHGNDMACWDDTDILSNHKELHAFADPSQGSHCISGKHEPQKRPNKTDLSYCGSDGYYPVLIEMSKVAKSNFSHSSKKALKNKSVKVNEPAKKGNFLHSENSAFESWNVHHKKLTEKEEFVDINMKEEGLACMEEAPFVEGSHTLEHKLPSVKTTARKQDFQVKPASPEASFSISHPSAHVPQGPLPSDTEFPQQGNKCPPWRRQRTAKGAAEIRQTSKEKFTDCDETCSLSEKVTGAEPAPDVTPLAKQANSPGSKSPTFNITKLLTPIIPPKQEVDAVESELIPLTPPPTESMASKDNEGSTSDDYKSQDSYKSKASSLLFNLKDVRKRVKSIYTPSPLLRALEEKHKTRANIQESTKINPSLSILQENSNKNTAKKDGSSDTTSVLPGSVHRMDNETDLAGHFTDNSSSPQTAVDLLFYQTGDKLQQDHPKHEDLIKSTRDNENFPLFRHESNDLALKHLQYRTPKPLSRDNVEITAGQPTQNPNVQGEENEKQTASQNENLSFKTVPNQLSPAQDVPYGDSHTNMLVPGHEAQGKRSTSSSEQSFVSTVEQPLQEEPFPPVPLMQKASLQESQKAESEMDTDSKKSHKEGGNEVGEDELQYYACTSSGTDAAEKKEEDGTDNEHKSLMKEELRKKEKEETSHMDSASDSIRDMSMSRSEETQTPPSSSSTKPSLFMIKDNTFRSPQVIRTVKLPLFRSFSLDDTVSSSYKEIASRFMPLAKHQNMLHAQEVGWWVLRCRRQQNVKDGATDKEKESSETGSTLAMLDPSHLDNTERFSLGKQMEEDKETYALLNKAREKNEESVCRRKEKPQTRKGRLSLTQPNLGLESDQAQNNSSYPAERQTNHFKNSNLFNRRGGSCAKKIITRETVSPVSGTMSEEHTCSPVSHETLEDILHTEGAPILLDNLACSAVPSPRSGSMIHSLAAVSPSDKPTIAGHRETEDTTNPASLSMALKHQDDLSVEERLDSARRNLLSDSSGKAERQEPMGLEDRAAGKPPAVPPKTEKALRRAKKLASRRKKMQEQQKKHQTEHADVVGQKHSLSGQKLASPSSLGCALLHSAPHSTSTPTETSTGRPSGTSTVSPSPSSSQRKILQDPDSGQYYVVDLPAEVNLKTFYDPETGKYVQVSVPSSEVNVYQPPSSEIMNSPYASYPKVLPLPASSLAVLKSPSQHSEPTWLMTATGEPAELPEDGLQDYSYTEVTDTQLYAEPAPYYYRQDAEETQSHLGKDMSPTTNTNLVSLTDLDDFAAEGIS
ncbi:CEFIP protein, partial [Rhinopomastus cyanomelas]|nr:CEFIP protein [Rhinopomastus cyanomelas]